MAFLTHNYVRLLTGKLGGKVTYFSCLDLRTQRSEQQSSVLNLGPETVILTEICKTFPH